LNAHLGRSVLAQGNFLFWSHK